MIGEVFPDLGTAASVVDGRKVVSIPLFLVVRHVSLGVHRGTHFLSNSNQLIKFFGYSGGSISECRAKAVVTGL